MYSLNTAYVSILLPQLMTLSLILTQFSKEQLMSHNQFASVEANYELWYSVSASAWKEMSHLYISNQVLSIFYERPGNWIPWVSTIWDRETPQTLYTNRIKTEKLTSRRFLRYFLGWLRFQNGQVAQWNNSSRSCVWAYTTEWAFQNLKGTDSEMTKQPPWSRQQNHNHC